MVQTSSAAAYSVKKCHNELEMRRFDKTLTEACENSKHITNLQERF